MNARRYLVFLAVLVAFAGGVFLSPHWQPAAAQEPQEAVAPDEDTLAGKKKAEDEMAKLEEAEAGMAMLGAMFRPPDSPSPSSAPRFLMATTTARQFNVEQAYCYLFDTQLGLMHIFVNQELMSSIEVEMEK